MPNAEPVTFGRYLLDAKLATGGMGEIFLARMKGPAGFEKKVIIKRILPHLAQSDEFLERFKDEGRLVVQLNHSNIVQIFEMGEEGGQYYLAMEYVDGVDLRAVLKQLKRAGQRVPSEIVLHTMLEMAKGLAHAHSRVGEGGQSLGVIHRDVSPSNIMISREGDVKLLDFGIAKAEGQVVNSIVGSLHGKFMYMSPEQAGGKALDKRSDIFSLGSCAYEMLTGQRPFVGHSEIETLELIRKVECEPVAALCPDLAQEVIHIIERCMARDVVDRFSSADELQRSLVNYLMESRQIVTNTEVAAFVAPHLDGGEMALPKSIDEALNQQIDALIAEPESTNAGTRLAGERLAFGETASALRGNHDTSTTGRRMIEEVETDLPKASRNRILLASLLLVVGVLVTLNLVTIGKLQKQNQVRLPVEAAQLVPASADKSTTAHSKAAANTPARDKESQSKSNAVSAPAPDASSVHESKPAPMKIRIRDLPAHALVKINGNSVTADAQGNYPVSEGEGEIAVHIEAPGQQAMERQVKRAAGMVVEIAVQLKALEKSVLIRSTPHASIFVGSKLVGTGSYRATVRPDEEVRGKAVLEGYITRTFKATYDGKDTIPLKLKKRQTGILEIRVMPANAEIRIDGKVVKRSSHQVNRLQIPVSPGDHRLVAKLPNGSQTVTRRFTIKSGQTIRLSQINLVD